MNRRARFTATPLLLHPAGYVFPETYRGKHKNSSNKIKEPPENNELLDYVLHEGISNMYYLVNNSSWFKNWVGLIEWRWRVDPSDTVGLTTSRNLSKWKTNRNKPVVNEVDMSLGAAKKDVPTLSALMEKVDKG